MGDAVPVPIRDESIRLGQFLKLANLIESGAEAKPLIAAARYSSTARSRPAAAASWSRATSSASAGQSGPGVDSTSPSPDNLPSGRHRRSPGEVSGRRAGRPRRSGSRRA